MNKFTCSSEWPVTVQALRLQRLFCVEDRMHSVIHAFMYQHHRRSILHAMESKEVMYWGNPIQKLLFRVHKPTSIKKDRLHLEDPSPARHSLRPKTRVWFVHVARRHNETMIDAVFRELDQRVYSLVVKLLYQCKLELLFHRNEGAILLQQKYNVYRYLT